MAKAGTVRWKCLRWWVVVWWCVMAIGGGVREAAAQTGNTTDPNDCFSEPCHNGGVCVDLFQMYRCDCPRNFNGTNCDEDLTLKYGCNVSPCLNGGTCNTLPNVSSGTRPYNCTCLAGYSGYNCQIQLNFCQASPQPCNDGQCLSGINTFTCNCTGTGFTGANCSEDINECNQGQPCGLGTCHNIPGNYSCNCPYGFDGKPCQFVDVCLSSPCQNGATCTPGLNTYNCTCPTGFSGPNCEINNDDCLGVKCSGQFEKCVDKVNNHECVCLDGYRKNVTTNVCTEINECESRPCKNGAACSDRINGYNCTCLPGYSGTICQTNIDECASGPCLNNATCVDNINAYTCLCKVGFTSSNCAINIDDCKVNFCRNGATCNDLVNGYKCNCSLGWSGQYCDQSVNECASNPCQNDGRCNDRVAGYSCTCPPGYSGVNCENNTNECQPNPCMNGATCQDLLNNYNCICSTQFMGKNCSEPYNACSFKPCKNNGICATDSQQRNYNCTCLSGYTGRNCETNINDCEGVRCPETYQVCHDGINNYTCGCPIGFEGPTCSQNIDECASNPCLNGGICYNGLGFYNCTCKKLEGSRLASYTGVNCEMDVDECAVFPPMCEHGGDCFNNIGSYRCRCWGESEDGNYLITGRNCDTLTTYCEVNRFPCQNGGTCHNGEGTYHCDCMPGFTDKNCSTNIDECLSRPCHYNGTCIDGINGYNCTCIPGITGANCETDIDECLPHPCNSGTCTDHINGFECNCTDTGFNGTVCDKNIDDCIPGICQHNGTCLDGIKEYSCSCLRGYTGQHCETDIEECASRPCQFNGTCLERSNPSLYGQGLLGFNDTFSYATAAGYVCQCIPGTTDLNCETNIDECVSSPCMNGGTCLDWINGYTCSCAPGYTGVFCGTEIDECALYQACQNGAKCTDLVANYSCMCPDFVRYNNNFGGRNCSVRLSGCDSGSGCKNGYCIPTLESESPVRHSYYCQCNPGFTGKFCDQATTLSFSSNGTSVSYNISAAAMTRQQVAFRFRTTLRNCVLLLALLNGTDSAAVEVSEGKLMVVYTYGAAQQRIFRSVDTQEQVNGGEWHGVTLDLRNNVTVSLVSGVCRLERCVQGFSYPTGKPEITSLTVRFGLLDQSYMSRTLTSQMFVGCLEDVVVDGTYLYPGQPGMYLNTQPSCPRTQQCDPYTCMRHGTCTDLWDTFRCDCNRPYWGKNCNQTYTSATFSKSSVPSLAVFELNNLTFTNGLDLSFFLQTRQAENSIILYLSNNAASPSTWTLSLETNNGGLAVRLTLCSPEQYFNDPYVRVNQGWQNFVELKLGNTSLLALVNNSVVINQTVNMQSCQFPALTAYVGKAPETAASGRRKRQASPTFSQLAAFNGVLRDIEMQNFKLDFAPRVGAMEQSIVVTQKVNLTVGAESTVSVCNTSTPCANGGNCSDVFFNDFRCDCPAGYLGKNCSQPDFCKVNSCQQHTRCQSLQMGFECIGVGSFDGKTGSVQYIQSQSGWNLTNEAISFKFRTRVIFGAILEIRQHGSSFILTFIKLRIRGGMLEVNYLLKDSGFSSSFRLHSFVNDGQWYTAEVSLVQASIKNIVRLAIKDASDKILDEGQEDINFPVTSLNDLVSHGANIKVGGALDNKEQAFRGCLEEVRVGGLLLPFIQDDQMVSNTAPQRFVAVNFVNLQVDTKCPNSSDMCQSNEHLCVNNAVCQREWEGFSCNCSSGYQGDLCQLRTEQCPSSRCQSGGQCVEHLGYYTCQCPSGYTGASCETTQDYCANNTCANNSTCLRNTSVTRKYVCNCSLDYAGDMCNVTIVNKTCADTLCQNGATCQNGTNGSSFTCNCKGGYTGTLCESTIDYCQTSPCHNGTCVSNASIQNYTCSCNPGYTGVVCETNINDCGSSPCHNGTAECVDGVNSYRCICSAGWTGQLCETDVNECNTNTCQHGYCHNLPGTYQCICNSSGFEGDNCTRDLDECSANFCPNATTANCTNSEGGYLCGCKIGYEGNNCTQATCKDNQCLNGATCLANDTEEWGTAWKCVCPKYYAGETCQFKGPCAYSPCSVENTYGCLQEELFYQTNISNYTCICKNNTNNAPAWEGKNCTDDINECESKSNPCLNSAKCTNTIGGFNCTCPKGYKGTLCQEDIDECFPRPCVYGHCSQGIGNYSCDCSGTGYKGENCTEDINECLGNDTYCSHGNCTNLIGANATCDCGKEYLGARCEHINPCNVSECGNGGFCNHTWLGAESKFTAVCICAGGFSGLYCEQSPQKDDAINLGIIIGPIVGGILLIAIIVLIVFIMIARKKRATRGAYSPSRQETAGARVELGNVLKKPPEERLI